MIRKKETINKINLIIKTLMYELPYKLNDDTIVTMIDNELYFRGEDLNGNEVWSKCIFELTLEDLIKQAENMSEEYAFELTANIVLFEMIDDEDTYELKPEIGYNEERGCIEPFKVCRVEQIISQDEDAITPEDILKNQEDIKEVKEALKVVAKFIKTADESGCWFDD